MTRINCVPPSELHDKHLLAEYRELPRIFKLARHAPDAPKQYVLGTGHMKFFFNKLMYLYNRQHELVEEMIKRGMRPNFLPGNLMNHHTNAGGTCPAYLWQDWEPTLEAMAINRARLNERLATMKSK